MVTIVYDGSFEGWLTAVFEVYEYKFESPRITTPARLQSTVFGKQHQSFYDVIKTERVWKGLASKLTVAALGQVYRCFLSEEKGIEDVLLQYVQYVFSSKQAVESDLSHPAVLKVVQTAKKVYREKHRMEAFIRFQLTADRLYYAICQPDFNVLPLIEKHFTSRYADQRWLIYDGTRKYGLYYDLYKTERVSLVFNPETENGTNTEMFLDVSEDLYQQLWQQYFNSVNIPARKNTRLHLQHMPRRYWKYLPEKRPNL